MLLDWALIFFIFALIAGVFGYTGIAADSAYIAKILFFVFVVLFLISFALRLIKKTPPSGI
ncbi:UPF0391 membrane protein [Candidatus Dependentiae bacterium Noda2021]|nr:UPF0391 membrane protein [Candidatus Dependentiae bacterium Noda2021]